MAGNLYMQGITGASGPHALDVIKLKKIYFSNAGPKPYIPASYVVKIGLKPGLRGIKSLGLKCRALIQT